MTEKQITYYLIKKCRLGKKEDVAYYLFIDAEWVWDEKNVIMDAEHRKLLETVPDSFDVLHYAAIAVLKKKDIRVE